MAMHNSTPPSSLPVSKQRNTEYRKARPLPLPLLDSCSIWIEEQLYTQAFSLFSSTLTAGTGTPREAFVPPPQHLALAATLVAHPLLTTRTTSPDKHVAADEALRYLRLANSLLGAENAGFDKAFQFADASSSTRGKRGKSRVSDIGSDMDEPPGRLNSVYASTQSLWSNADDFWAVVGWAFNCSVAHPHRWARWKLWLGFMFDVLQDDLEHRMPEAEKLYAVTQSTVVVEGMLEHSLLARYLVPIGEGRNSKRRLLRAVLADGKEKSLAEFGEVWKGETKAPKVKGDERTAAKRRKLDLENGDFGDYFDDSEEESVARSAQRSRSGTAAPSARASRAASDGEDDEDELMTGATTPSTASSAAGIEVLGGMESLRLRQRILALLSFFCSKSPDAFLDTEDLFDLYTEFLRPLPLAIFQQFVLPAKPWLGPNSQASLNQMLLRPLLVAAAPAYNENALTQAEFEVYYAPFAANNTSAVDNAKVGLLMESLLRLLWSARQLDATPRLREAVEQGIGARKAKAAFDGRRKVGGKIRVEEDALAVMECSGERMRAILDMA